MSGDDPCSRSAMRAEIRANARSERGLLGVALLAVAITGVVLVFRVLVA